MLLFPPSHAFAIHFLTSQEETRTDLGAMLQHSKGRNPRSCSKGHEDFAFDIALIPDH